MKKAEIQEQLNNIQNLLNTINDKINELEDDEPGFPKIPNSFYPGQVMDAINPKVDVDSRMECLNSAFDWDDTPQKYDYWCSIMDNINEGEKLPMDVENILLTWVAMYFLGCDK